MVFNSLTFVFLCFIPCVLLILLAEKTGGKFRIPAENAILLAFSLLFFAWSGTEYVKVLVFLILANYLLGRWSKRSRIFLLAGVALNLGVLFYYKYLNMILSTYNNLFHKDFYLWDILAPLGISFIIFQCISYLMDLFQNNAKPCKNLLDFALYLSFFPKLSQGPIVKYKDMEGQLKNRRVDFDGFLRGLERFIIGLSKKVLIADILADTYSGIFYNMAIGMDAGTAWIALLSFGFGLYMDFSGYSDMAIGMAAMFGFEFKENFNFPYLSGSVTEFWRRWHISLGAWFREYLYIPMGGSRKGNVYLHLFLVFMATGIWHGAAWIYLLWGAMHGVCVAAERWMMKRGWYERIPFFFRWAATFLIVNIGWITFNVQNIYEFKEFFLYLLGMGEAVSFSAVYYLTPRLLSLWGIVIGGTLLFSRPRVQNVLKRWNESSAVFCGIKYLFLLGCVFLCFITVISEGYTPFIYFPF